MTDTIPSVRLMWTLFESIHAVTYFAPDGQARYQQIEDTTDVVAEAPWQRLTEDERDRLVVTLRPLAYICATEIPFPNPIGLPRFLTCD